MPVPRNTPQTASIRATSGYVSALPIKYIFALTNTSRSALLKRKVNIGWLKAAITAPAAMDTTAIADIELAAAVNTCSRLPAPVYWATRTVPPVASAIKIFSMMTFIESTMLTAAISASPDELIIAVLKKEMTLFESWSKSMGTNIAITCR